MVATPSFGGVASVSAVAHVGLRCSFPTLGDKKAVNLVGFIVVFGARTSLDWKVTEQTNSQQSLNLIAWSHHCIGPAMFERFTEKAIKVIMLAQEEARRLGHNFVGTEQILLGLIGEDGVPPRCSSPWG